MDYKQSCKEIIKYLGGEDNISYVFHCATRLRFNLKNESIINENKLKQIPGVLGLANKSGQYQIIIGPSVDKWYREFIQLGDFTSSINSKSNFKELDANKKSNKHKITLKSILMNIIDAIAGSFNPILPAIIGCAMLKVVTIFLKLTGILLSTSSTYQVLNFVNDSSFYFMPFLLAVSAAKKFNSNPYLALTVAGFLLHPNFMEFVTKGQHLNFIGLPIGLTNYSGTVFPIISIIWLQSLLEKFLDNKIPEVIKYLLKPLLLLLIMIPIALCILGPVTSYLAVLLAKGFSILSTKIGWLFTVLLAIGLNFLVPVGMHSGIVPLILNNLSNQGFDATFFASYLAFHFALAGSGLAVAIKSKRKITKETAFTGAATTLLGGITEPLLFGVHLKLKTPFIGSIIGSAVAGAYAGIVKVTAYVFAFPSITSVLMWKASNGYSNIINAIITMMVGLIVGFLVTMIVNIKEEY